MSFEFLRRFACESTVTLKNKMNHSTYKPSIRIFKGFRVTEL